MTEKLISIKNRFKEVEQLIVQPDAMSDMKEYTKLNQEYRALEKIVVKACLLYTSPSPRDLSTSRMPSSA